MDDNSSNHHLVDGNHNEDRSASTSDCENPNATAPFRFETKDYSHGDAADNKHSSPSACETPIYVTPADSSEENKTNLQSDPDPPNDTRACYSHSRDEELALPNEEPTWRVTDYGTGQIEPAQDTPAFHMSFDQDDIPYGSDDSAKNNEKKPFLMKIPHTVEFHSGKRYPSVPKLDDMVDSMFSTVRSVSTATVEAEVNESDEYLANSTLARAFPERFIALMVTLMVEIPTVVMISGGSDRLCKLIGRSKYQLMMAFLPLSSAISGNVGLQASTLTTRAISHRHVTRDDYRKWFRREVGAAAYLGFGMGVVIGSVAFVASGYSLEFGFTIFMAQQVSILTAGVTGTFAPLMFSFIFHRDSGKWGGPLETAVQDIVGSFAMVIMSYRVLLLLGPGEVEPYDRCGSEVS